MAKRVVGYFENWAQYRQAGGKFFPAQINPGFFTHINFAFGLFGFVTWSVDPNPNRTGAQRLTGDYTVQPVEWNDQTMLYPALQALKQQNGNLKTLLSIGGWSMNSCSDTPNPGNEHPYGPYTCQLFSQMAADPNGRAQFINSAIAYAEKYGFDGIDIDWEYPGYVGRGGGPNDLANFLSLAQEFRAAAGPNFLLTMAAPAIVPTGLPQSYHDNPSTFFSWLQQCAQSFDWLNIMSYDYHGAFDDPVAIGTGVNAPLPQDSTPNGPFSIKQTVEAYLAAGISPDQMVLGMPTYGRGYIVSNPGALTANSGYGQPFSGPSPAGPATQTPGVLAYYEITPLLAGGSLTEVWDANTLTPYAYNATSGEWVSYENPGSVAYKTAYVNAMNLGGAMIWSIDNDDFANGYPLISKITDILGNPADGPQLPSGLVTGQTGSPQNWLGSLEDTPKLSRLTLPGTHDSGAIHPLSVGPIAECQGWSIAEQLNQGIRYLDIRCRHIQNIFAIHHEQIYCGFNFGAGVRDVCVNFLKANPTECIVMQIKHEYIDADNTQTFQQTLDGYINGFENFFYLDDHIPTLGEVRGKIVVIRRFTLDSGASRGLSPDPWADNATFEVTYNAQNGETVAFEIQDQYQVATILPLSINPKWGEMQALLDRAKSDASDAWYINFASGSGGAWAYPNAIAGQMKPFLYNYLASAPFANRLGTLMMDFPDIDMIGEIIRLNTQAAAASGRALSKQRRLVDA